MRGVPEYCIYAHRSRRTSVAVLTPFSFGRIPAVWRESKGRTTHGGRPGSASSTSRTTRETSSSRSSLSLRRLAPALQACLLFSPTGLKRTAENLGDVFLALYMLLGSVIFPRFTNLICWGISGPTRSFFPGLLRVFALRAQKKKGRGVGWGSRSDL